MEALPLGFRFKPSDPEIITYLDDYVRRRPYPRRFIMEYNLNNFQVEQMEQPPDVSKFGSLGRLYLVTDCFYKESGPMTRDRCTVDGKGCWKCIDRQKDIIYKDDQIVGYKQDFRFHRQEAGKKKSTTWVMTEYTLIRSNESRNEKAICVLRVTEKKI